MLDVKCRWRVEVAIARRIGAARRELKTPGYL